MDVIKLKKVIGQVAILRKEKGRKPPELGNGWSLLQRGAQDQSHGQKFLPTRLRRLSDDRVGNRDRDTVPTVGHKQLRRTLIQRHHLLFAYKLHDASHSPPQTHILNLPLTHRFLSLSLTVILHTINFRRSNRGYIRLAPHRSAAADSTAHELFPINLLNCTQHKFFISLLNCIVTSRIHFYGLEGSCCSDEASLS